MIYGSFPYFSVICLQYIFTDENSQFFSRNLHDFLGCTTEKEPFIKVLTDCGGRHANFSIRFTIFALSHNFVTIVYVSSASTSHCSRRIPLIVPKRLQNNVRLLNNYSICFIVFRRSRMRKTITVGVLYQSVIYDNQYLQGKYRTGGKRGSACGGGHLGDNKLVDL